MSSYLSKISFDSVLIVERAKFVSKDFVKKIENIKFDPNMIIEGSKVYSNDSIVFILRDNTDLTFMLNGSGGISNQYYISNKKENISAVTKVAKERRLLMKHSFGEFASKEEVFFNSFCVRGEKEVWREILQKAEILNKKIF